tara:strand:+ start:209 stop:490 length:282 start_codon:yes stop_codon:yes gene_type:complete
MGIGLKMLEAVKAEILGTRAKATANLEVLLSNPVGIGEHIDLVSDVHSLISEIAEADDKLDVLDKKIGEYTSAEKSNNSKFYPSDRDDYFDGC